MKNEAPTILPAIGFVVTAFLAVRVIIKYNFEFSRAAKKLKQAYAAAGREWDYMGDFAFRWRLFTKPEGIREVGDSIEIADAKNGLIACRAVMHRTIWKAIKIMLIGFSALILLAFVEAMFRHFL